MFIIGNQYDVIGTIFSLCKNNNQEYIMLYIISFLTENIYEIFFIINLTYLAPIDLLY